MREILFRGKRLDNGEWIEGFVFDDDGVDHPKIFIGSLVIEPYKGTACDDWDITGTCFSEVIPETVCQFTGLTDKNGVKIFEGDIVRCSTGRICKVTFFISPANSGFDFVAIDGFDAPAPYNWALFSNAEVIGNIFDNPEMMEGGGSDE